MQHRNLEMTYKITSLKHILHFSKIVLSSMLILSIPLFVQNAVEAINDTSAADSKQSSLSGQSVTGCLAKVRKDGKWGYIDTQGKVIIPFQYDFAWKFSNGLAMVRKSRKNGYINKKGEVIIPFKVEHVSSFNNELAKVRNNYNNKYGFIDITGKIVIPCQFDEAADFSEGLARVYDYSSRRYGFIDKTGKLVIPYKYLYASESDRGIFKEGLSAENRGGPNAATHGYIDKAGEEVIPFHFCMTRGFSEGLAAVMKCDGEWLYIDNTGKTIIQLPRNHSPSGTGGFKEGLARVYTSQEIYYMDKLGNKITTPYNSHGQDFSEGLAVIEKGFLWGYIDKTGKAVIPFQFEEAGSFTNGRARVQANDGKWGYIDKTGQVVIPCQFEYAWEFNIAD